MTFLPGGIDVIDPNATIKDGNARLGNAFHEHLAVEQCLECTVCSWGFELLYDKFLNNSAAVDKTVDYVVRRILCDVLAIISHFQASLFCNITCLLCENNIGIIACKDSAMSVKSTERESSCMRLVRSA